MCSTILKTLKFIMPVLLVLGCGNTSRQDAIISAEAFVRKKGELDEKDKEQWSHLDIIDDSIPGISLDKAYKFLKNKTGKQVIVGVIDSGLETSHEDLKENLWENTDEIAANGIDDDDNGYVDDVMGWNFLGNLEGSIYYAQYEMTRIFKQYDPIFRDRPLSDIKASDTVKFNYYHKAKKAYEEKSKQSKTNYLALKDREDLDDQLEKKREHYAYGNKYGYNLELHPRKKIGDDVNDFNDRHYGNHNVGSIDENESHSTHVTGIFGAVRSNGIGMDGIANNVKVMPVRTVPKGDEYDKDVALAIRYAVDNGAQIINMSFGKPFSPYAQWVWDAIKYAESKDVLLVNAAGNDSKNIDVETFYPTDHDGNSEFVNNMITVGSSTRHFNLNLVSNFSNYGKKQVDLFAPGSEIYSTVLENKYDYNSGTSMAAPCVSGVAALIRSYYPSLTAPQVKNILMNSGVEYKGNVIQPGDGTFETVSFAGLSVSGRILNAYNALVMADEVTNKDNKQ